MIVPTREDLIARVAEAEYEHDRGAFDFSNGLGWEPWPDWQHRNGVQGADYMNRARAGVDALADVLPGPDGIPPYMEYDRTSLHHTLYRVRS